MTDEQIVEFLVENRDFFITNDLVISILRSIGWMLVKGLNSLLDACQMLYDYTFGLIDITSWSVLEDFLAEYGPLLQGIMVLSLVVLGYMYLFGKNKNHDLLTSLLIFAVVFTSSTTLFSTFNSFSVLFKDAVIGTEGAVDGNNLVNQNLYDLIYIDEQIGLDNMSSGENPPQYPSMTEEDVAMIDITETLSNDKEGLTDNAKDILSKKLEYRIEQSELTDVYNGVAWTDFANTFYYRYQFHYGTYYLTAIAAIVVFLGVSYKNVRVIYELFVSRILVTMFSADLSGKRKAVRLLEAIRDGYYALCFTALTLRSYFLFTEYVTQTGANGLVRGIVILFVAFCVVDGANIMEKITGVDAGLSTMAGKLIAGMHAVRGAVMAGQQMRQMSMMKRQTKAMEAMAGTGKSMAGGNGQGSGNMPDPGSSGGAAQDGGNTDGNSGGGTGDAGGGASDQNSAEASGQNGGAEYSQEGDPETGNGGSGDSLSGNGSEGASDADSHFSQMDDALDQSGSGAGASEPMENTGPEMGSGGEEKGMFERRAEKAEGTRTGQDAMSDVGNSQTLGGAENRHSAASPGESRTGYGPEKHSPQPRQGGKRAAENPTAPNAREPAGKKEKKE